MSPDIVFDRAGNELHLKKIGKAGGEGEIFKIEGRPHECAKIYHPNKIDPEHHQKIMAMIDNVPDDPTWNEKKRHRSFAWPTDLLYSDRASSNFVGFTMPLIDLTKMKESHMYFDGDGRIKNFGGGFTWKKLFATALNLTGIVSAIHQKGHRIGDMRETNVLVSQNGRITLIDCDSFQIKDRSGKIYYSRAFTNEYLPPEFFSMFSNNEDLTDYYDRFDLRDYSDRFALGILIFQFLMNGCHPFQSMGRGVDEAPSIADKIKKGFFPYSKNFKCNLYDVYPPPYAPPYEIIPPALQELFERCFVDGYNYPEKRPTSAEWQNALKNEINNIKKCKHNHNHWYYSGLNQCPWCKIFYTSGKDLFPPPLSIISENTKIPPPVKLLINLAASQPKNLKPSILDNRSSTATYKVYRDYTTAGYLVALMIPCTLSSYFLISAAMLIFNYFMLNGLTMFVNTNYIIALIATALVIESLYGRWYLKRVG